MAQTPARKTEYMRAYRARRKDDPAFRAIGTRATAKYRNGTLSALATLKLETGCVDCGYNADPVALDFDHVRGEKLFGIATPTGLGKGLSAILDEVEKCDVVCANCHRVRTSNRRSAQ